MMNAVTWDFPPEKVQRDGGWTLITTVKWLVAIFVGHLLYSYNAERERAQPLGFINPRFCSRGGQMWPFFLFQ